MYYKEDHSDFMVTTFTITIWFTLISYFMQPIEYTGQACQLALNMA